MSIISLRIMVLEDHRAYQALLLTMLRQMNCTEIVSAYDGVQALNILSQLGPVDVVICDLRMDGMDGLEFLKRASALKLINAVIISSSLSADLRRAVWKMVSLLGMHLLGDIGKPANYIDIERLLINHVNNAATAQPKQPTAELVSRDEVFEAFACNQLKAYFQPKVDLHTGAVNSVEALVRWEHPTKGVLPPSVFLQLLSECNLIDEWLLEQIKQGISLRARALKIGHALNIAINLEAAQLQDESFSKKIRSILSLYRIPGACLTFELTEGGLLEVSSTSLETLVRLRMLGCKLSIDDFGAGFSSMQRLSQLPFNEIKLDGEFVRSLESEPRCRAIIRSTLDLGRMLEMSVVIEGIETIEQHKQLVELGCNLGQGYLYARPMSSDALVSWIEARATSRFPSWSSKSTNVFHQ